MSQVEDWSEGDFDLEHTALRTDSTSLQDVHPFSRLDLDDQPNWDEDFPEDNPDENSDEQTETIKLSSAAGSALKLILEANKASTSAAAHQDLEDQLRPPALDLARISQFANTDHTTGAASEIRAYSTGSLSTCGSTSGLSTTAFSTDLTDPDTPNSKQSAHQASSISSRSSINARSDLDDPLSDLGDAFETDFDLAPDMNNLSLCSSLSRARSNTSLSHVSRDIWDDDPAPLTGTTHTSSSSLHPPAFPDHPPSAKSVSGESDADDEHEDMLEGLDFEGSVFATLPAASAASNSGIKAKLEAILDLKRSGQPSATGGNDQISDSDTGIAAGLIIDDDFDISPSRIAARGLPSKPCFSSVPAQNSAFIGGSGSSASHAHERRHPVRSASDSPAQVPSTRSEVRASNRNRLSIKRSTSDLHSHANPSTTSSTFRRPPTRGSQLTRKRSLPSVRTTPPTNSPSGAAPPTLSARAPSIRQRHNSGNADASTNLRSRSNVGSRLTDSTAASRARAAETAADQLARLQRDASAPARPSTPTSFNPRSTYQPASRISVHTRAKARSHLERRMSSGESQPAARLLKRSVLYGNGAELDGIDDLPSSSGPPTSQPQASSVKSSQHKAAAKDHSDAPSIPGENQRKRGGRRGKRGKPALIRPLGAGATPAQKTVKGMRWNAHALRWEGNEGVLRDFDQVIQRSTRPALISQMTGSSTSSALNQVAGYSSPLSPESSTLMNSIASGARVVGDMLFDPIQMRWIPKSGDEEEDVFAGFDDALEGADGFPDAPAARLGVDGDSTLRARRTRSTEAFSLSSNPWTPLGGQQRATQDTDAVIRHALSRGIPRIA
ncbi:hypothetical protein PSEUBRA_005454 [Kalmanozyma brasiliensis GHG001]|uniref:uncharacterized protein n=1 Tax=Kalmanozyma brasiliensis (strain GHG001) TaxID=1365824 RepID=UPI002867E73B|nr:uncharacterized protein PSEUBRA_005454 [Kalmanozyma brasiliensis GHG001]EST05191.2 hypothetical protein PSEUBRA_005454 [Kalmanozyma brasiliensis GHG001]